MSGLAFPTGTALTMGVELELQVLNRHDYDLVRGASDLLALAERTPHPGDIKPEITESMVELSTGIHTEHDALLGELRATRDALTRMAERLNLALAGGGAHPFQHWRERAIFDTPRFQHLSGLYGYLAKQFTVFGQHVHVGGADGDQAVRLLHGLSRFVPHFVALSAASPYYQGVDTAYDSARLNSIAAFPLSGRAPFVRSWAEFSASFERMRGLGLVESMKDFYWDIRPKPEYGTVEVRVFDTPLTVERAAALAAYVQALAAWLIEDDGYEPSEDDYLTYGYNRFQASRFGLDGELLDPRDGRRTRLRDDVAASIERIRPQAVRLGSWPALTTLRDGLAAGNDAAWMRLAYEETRSLNDLMRLQSDRWCLPAG
jgi:carboxylate-amine ligase